MTTTPPSDLSVSFSESGWLRFLTSDQWRPNLLVSCNEITLGPAVMRLIDACSQPLSLHQVFQHPGQLNLPEALTGTLMLWDVAQLTPDQQVELYQWMNGRHEDAQIVSLTSTHLPGLVERGQFHEGLFYRLNVISMRASVDGGRPGSTRDTPFRLRRPLSFDGPSTVHQSIGNA